MKKRKVVKIGIVGCGAIGEGVAVFIYEELKDKAQVWALADAEEKTVESLREKLGNKPKVLDIDRLIKQSDFVIEAASQKCAVYVLKQAIEFKKDVLILSVGALIQNESLLKLSEEKGINVYVPSGAICGTDGIGALSLGNMKRISLTTAKPTAGLQGSAYFKEKGIDLAEIKEEKIIFEGNVKEAVRYFPQNINVAATILLASSLGKKDIKVCIKVSPKLKRNIHRIEIEAEEANINIEIENVPSKINPKTSILAILSTQNLLRKIFSSFKIGS